MVRNNKIDMLELFGYQFFINALLAAALVSVTCGIIGTYIVSRKIVFISGGISHASFGGVGIAYYLGINPMLGAALFAVITAVGIEHMSTRSVIRRDTLIGMTWSFGMAIGILFIYLTPGYSANLMTFLFGNILTVSHLDLLLMALMALLTSSFFIIFFREILAISFDEEYARSQGIPIFLFNSILIALVALTIVICIRVVGIILVISLLTIPQATASLMSKKFKHIIFLSILWGFAASISGLLLSYFFRIPSGATIILVAIILFFLVKLYQALIH